MVFSYKLPCLVITYLVYDENYHVCFLITTRANQSGEYGQKVDIEDDTRQRLPRRRGAKL